MTRYWKNEAGGGGVGDIFFQKGELCIPYTAYVHVYIYVCIQSILYANGIFVFSHSLSSSHSVPSEKSTKERKFFFQKEKTSLIMKDDKNGAFSQSEN